MAKIKNGFLHGIQMISKENSDEVEKTFNYMFTIIILNDFIL